MDLDDQLTSLRVLEAVLVLARAAVAEHVVRGIFLRRRTRLSIHDPEERLGGQLKLQPFCSAIEGTDHTCT